MEKNKEIMRETRWRAAQHYYRLLMRWEGLRPEQVGDVYFIVLKEHHISLILNIFDIITQFIVTLIFYFSCAGERIFRRNHLHTVCQERDFTILPNHILDHFRQPCHQKFNFYSTHRHSKSLFVHTLHW